MITLSFGFLQVVQDRLYEVIVRREEHQDLTVRVRTLEQEVADLKNRFAA